MTDVAVLTRQELIALADCEQRIEQGMKTFIEVGMSLAAIRANKLYRGEYPTFEAYCSARWNFTGRRGRQLIEAAEIGTVVPIENENQARELAKVPEPERAEVWSETVENTKGKPTAKAIRAVRKKRTKTPGPSDAASDPSGDPGTTSEPESGPPGASEELAALSETDPQALVKAALDQFVPDPGKPTREWRKQFYDQHAPASKFLTWLNVDDFARYANADDVETLRLYASFLGDIYHRVTVQLGNNANVVPLRRVQ